MNKVHSYTIECPLCDATLHFVPLGQYWTCEDCPAILIEYINKGDAHKVADTIEIINQ